MTEKSTIEDVAKRSGLTVSVVKSLLDAGYSYNESIHDPVKWVRDAHLLRKK